MPMAAVVVLPGGDDDLVPAPVRLNHPDPPLACPARERGMLDPSRRVVPVSDAARSIVSSPADQTAPRQGVAGRW